MESNGLEFLLDPVDRFALREEFADSLEQTDSVPVALLPQGAGECSAGPESNGASGCAQVLGAGLQTGSGEEVRRRKNASPMQSVQFTGKANPEAPGWTKRFRFGSAPPDRTRCASRTSALQQSIRKYAEEPSKSVIKPEFLKVMGGLAFL